MITRALGLSTYDISALVALVNQERLGEAERSARILLKAYPNAGMLWKILSVAQLRQGKDALPALRKTTELMPQDAEAHRNLGAALHDQGQWVLAIESFRSALALAPHDADCLVEAADALRALGRPREAVPLYQQALQHNPALVEAQNNLGNAFLELAEFAQAAAWYQRALHTRPNDALILCNLGNAERQLGNPDEAITILQRAVAIDASLSVAHKSLGLVLVALGRREEAVAAYRQALTLNPNDVEALDSLGNALFELRRFQEAVACYTQALRLNPDYAPAHLSMGLSWRQQRRPADAEQSCQAALAINPDYVEALWLLGELRADRGHFAEAEELFQRVIAINPQYSFAYASMATHRKMSTDDEVWLKNVEALLARRLPLAHEISLRYGLGKYFDDVGQYKRAFENYRQANELTKRYGSTYNRDKLSQRVEQIMRCFDAAHMHSPASLGSTSELAVFIIGMPRSGTSLAEQILASHSAVFGAGEVPFWDSAFSAYLQATLDEAVDPTLIPRMAIAYLERCAATSQGALRVVDKVPANFLYAGLIHAAFPRARIIHMQRHPIDTCLSVYFQNFVDRGPYSDLDDLAHYYGQYVRIMDHWRAVLPPTALLEVSYEALIEDQEGWSRKMLDFIGLPWDPKCLDFHQTERAVITASKWQVRQKIHSASAGRWRNYEQFIGPLRAALGDALKP